MSQSETDNSESKTDTITENDINWNVFMKHEKGISNMNLGGIKTLEEYKAATLKYIDETYRNPPHSER